MTGPKWAWCNLSEDDARQLDADLQQWITDHNAHLTTSSTHVIPACWRQHPALTQVLPVIYWGWRDSHRGTDASIAAALEFHGRHLPGFQARLDEFLVDKASATECRSGLHPVRPDADVTRLEAVARATSRDPEQRGPDAIDVLRKTTFGT